MKKLLILFLFISSNLIAQDYALLPAGTIINSSDILGVDQGARTRRFTFSQLSSYFSGGVGSVFGRTGVVVAVEGDYNIDKLSDVIIASPGTGQLLRFNGTNWVNTGLIASDIPSLDAAKITTGTFADSRIASAATWNAKENAITAGAGLTRTVNTISVNISQNITTLSNLNTVGVVKTNATGVLSSGLVADADIANGTISNSKLANTAVANLSGTNTGDNATNTQYANDFRASNFVAGTNYLAPTGSASGLTGFPTLNQNTTGTASNITGVAAVANGGTGATTAAGARTNLGIGPAGATTQVQFNNAGAFGASSDLRWSSGELIIASPTNSRVQFNYAGNFNGGIQNALAGDLQFFFGMANNGVYGGTAATASGRFMGYYDFVANNWRYGFNASGDMFVGSSNTVFTTRLGPTGNLLRSGSVGIASFVAQGIASQTANLAEFQNSAGTALVTVSPSGDLQFSSGIKGIRHNGVKVLDFSGTTSSFNGFLMSATSTAGNLYTPGHLELSAGANRSVRSLSMLDFGSTGAGGSITNTGVATFGEINGRVGTGGAIAKVGGVLKTYVTSLATTTGNEVDYFNYAIPANTLLNDGDEIIYELNFGSGSSGSGAASADIYFNAISLVPISTFTNTNVRGVLIAKIIRLTASTALVTIQGYTPNSTMMTVNTTLTLTGLNFTTLINFKSTLTGSPLSCIGYSAKIKYEPANP